MTPTTQQTKKLYFVKPINDDMIDNLDAVFDSLEKAESYNNRYKTKTDFEIITLDFNSDYETDRTIDPYEVCYSKMAIQRSSQVNVTVSFIQDQLKKSNIGSILLLMETSKKYYFVFTFLRILKKRR